MSNWWVISWLVINYWRWSMSNRSPRILWPTDYSLTIIPCTKDTFLAFLYLFFLFWCICARHIFPCIWSSCEQCRDTVLITNTDDSQLCNISLYPTIHLIRKQVNSNQPFWKWNKLADKNWLRGYHFLFVGVCQQSKTASA